MRALVTCGPTYEPLDEVRRLTNFSTGKLGIELANFLADRGHEVCVLRGSYVTYPNPCRARKIHPFTTTDHLARVFQSLAAESWDAIFHAAAVSDFKFGAILKRSPAGELIEFKSGKFSTRDGPLFAQLVPTKKILPLLRPLFPQARIFGWKFEIEGDRERVIETGKKQLGENRTDYCVVNGPAYADGYGVIAARGLVAHCPAAEALYTQLEQLTGTP